MLIWHPLLCPSELSVHFWRGLFFSFSAACMQVIIFFTLKFYECVSTYSHLVALSILLNHNYISKSFQICYIKKPYKKTGKRVDKWVQARLGDWRLFNKNIEKEYFFVVCLVIVNTLYFLNFSLYITSYGKTHVFILMNGIL